MYNSEIKANKKDRYTETQIGSEGGIHLTL